MKWLYNIIFYTHRSDSLLKYVAVYGSLCVSSEDFHGNINNQATRNHSINFSSQKVSYRLKYVQSVFSQYVRIFLLYYVTSYILRLLLNNRKKAMQHLHIHHHICVSSTSSTSVLHVLWHITITNISLCFFSCMNKLNN